MSEETTSTSPTEATVEYDINNPNFLRVTQQDPLSKKFNTRTWHVTGILPAFLRWTEGVAMIQDCLPMLSASEREFLLTGITDESWDLYVRPEDDDK